MAESIIEIVFEPYGRKAQVPKGSLVTEAAAAADVWVDVPCGGKATCGKCRVRIDGEVTQPSEVEQSLLGAEELADGLRLACQTQLLGDCAVLMPDTATNRQVILTTGELRHVRPDPAVEKRVLRIPSPSLEDQRADIDRILDALGDGWHQDSMDLVALQHLPGLLRRSDFVVTAVLTDGKLAGIEPGDTDDRRFGMAFDLGTTTVVGYLLDLATGKQLAVASALNEQAMLGDDVISRITFAGERPEGSKLLREKILNVVNQLLQEACAAASISPLEVYQVLVVGNTCMSHLFFGVETQYLAQAPYVPAVRRGIRTTAAEAGIEISPLGFVAALPNIASFVGADTVGVILSTGIHHSDNLKLAVDIGTNGELVLGNRERLLACSTAAGPAFEGARISCGMRGTTGAIDSVQLEYDGSGAITGLSYTTIEGARPRGLCGSGLIDLVAALLDAGVVDYTGRIVDTEEVPASAQALTKRITPGVSGNDLLLAGADETASTRAIILTQRDVRELQLAKGAIHAGIRVLCREMETSWDRVDEVLLAGAFGNYVRKESALRIGLIPDFEADCIRSVGNAAGAGARMALTSRQLWLEADGIPEKVDYVELGGRTDFQSEFAEAMLFPMPGF